MTYISPPVRLYRKMWAVTVKRWKAFQHVMLYMDIHFCIEVNWNEVSYGAVLGDKSTMYIRVTLYWGYLIVLWLFHLVWILYCACFNLFCNVRVFWNCVCVLVICVLVYTVFCIVCTVFLYFLVYVYLFLFLCLYWCKDYCHRVITHLQ